MWVVEGHTARLFRLCVGVLFAHSLAVWVYTGVGYVHTVAMSSFGAQPDVNGTAPSWAHWFSEVVCVCGNRGRRTHNGYPRGSGRAGDEAAIRWYFLVYLCRCNDRPLRPEGWYNMATHPNDS